MVKEFTTAKKRTDPIVFMHDEREITFQPHKSSKIVLALADGDFAEVMGQTFDWLGEGLSDEDSAYFEGRLHDEDDDFTIDDLQEVIQYLQEEIAGRPTTSRRGLSRQQRRSGRN